MIAPEKQDHPYLQLTVNANGAVVALRYIRKGFTKQMEKTADYWQSSASVGEKSWRAEISLPLSLIREICPEDRGRIGIFRTRVLASPDPKLRGFFTAHSGLDAEAPDSVKHHNISRYRPFTISEK